jgi:hypothetical protein
MDNITGQRVGGKYLLSGISYALDDEKKIMVHEGLDDEQKSPVAVLIISQEIGQDDIDRLVTHLQHRGMTILGRGGFHQRATYIVTPPLQDETISNVYHAWSRRIETEPKPAGVSQPQLVPADRRKIGRLKPTPQVQSRNRRSLIFGIIASILVSAFAAVFLIRGMSSDGTIFFSDNFDNAEKTGNQWNPEAGNWQIVGGRYTCTTDESRCLSLVTSIPSSIFTIHVDVVGQEGVDKSIYFGFTNQRSFSVSLRAAPINQIMIIETIKGQADKVLAQASFENSNETQYAIKIRVQAQLLEVYLNDSLQLSARDESFQNLTGFVGLGIEQIKNGNTNKNSADFDNFEIRIYE